MKKIRIIKWMGATGLAILLGLGLCLWVDDVTSGMDISDDPSVSVLIGREYELREPVCLIRVMDAMPYAFRLYPLGSCSSVPETKEDFEKNTDYWLAQGRIVTLLDTGTKIHISRVLQERLELVGDIRVICGYLESGPYEGEEVCLSWLSDGWRWDETLNLQQRFLKPLSEGIEQGHLPLLFKKDAFTC